MLTNVDETDRGLHIVVVNRATGSVEMAQIFDTYKYSYGFDDFIKDDIPEDHIIIAACKDDCVTNLSDDAKQWFADLGSKEIWNLKYRQSFAFIGKTGKQEVNEKRAEHARDEASVCQIFVLSDDVDYAFDKS